MTQNYIMYKALLKEHIEILKIISLIQICKHFYLYFLNSACHDNGMCYLCTCLSTCSDLAVLSVAPWFRRNTRLQYCIGKDPEKHARRSVLGIKS